MTQRLRTMLTRDTGASAVEYALLVAGVAAIIVAIVFVLGTRTSSLYSKTDSCISAGGGSTC